MFELFDHTADLGIRVRCESLESLFAESATALFSTIVENFDRVVPTVSQTVEVEADERELLLFDWLSELLFLFETEQLIFSKFEITISEPTRLMAVCHGVPIDENIHDLHHEVKAITYHGLKVEPKENGWLAEFIIDI